MKQSEVKLTVKNRIEDLLRVNSIFESFATQHEIGGRLRYHLLVSIEEILTNIINTDLMRQELTPSISLSVTMAVSSKWNLKIVAESLIRSRLLNRT